MSNALKIGKVKDIIKDSLGLDYVSDYLANKIIEVAEQEYELDVWGEPAKVKTLLESRVDELEDKLHKLQKWSGCNLED